MLFKILIIIVFFINCEVSFVSAVIGFDYKTKANWLANEEPDARYVANINEPFSIHLDNISIAYGWCSDFDLDIQIENVPRVNVSGIHFENITDVMSTLWNCVLSLDHGWDDNSIGLQVNTNYGQFSFHLHVKGAKTVQVTVNNEELAFVRANLSLPYDGEAVYLFEEDQNVDVVCKNNFATGSVHIKFITKDFSSVDPKNVTDVSKFTVKLTSKYVQSSFECVYTSEFNEAYVYRINFLPKPSENSVANFINKLINNPDKNATYLIIGCSIGAAIVVLVFIVIGCYFKKHRKDKNEHSPQKDLYTMYDTPAPDLTNTYVNDIANRHYVNEEYYNASCSAYDTYSAKNIYAEINYDTCKQKINEIQTRESLVYDAPYGRISVIRANHKVT